MKYFSEEHHWIEMKSGVGVVGLSAYAIEELGKITFIDLPAVGMVISQGEAMCVVESAKAASDVVAPVGGTVVAVNEKLEEDPDTLNTSPEQEGWICQLGEIDKGEFEVLMTEEEYETFLADGDEDE